MPPSHTPTVNYQEHFGIDNTSRRRGIRPIDQNNVTPVPGPLSLGGDAQDEFDSTGAGVLSEAEEEGEEEEEEGEEWEGEGEGEGEDESEGDDVLGEMENVNEDEGEDMGLEEVPVEERTTTITTNITVTIFIFPSKMSARTSFTPIGQLVPGELPVHVTAPQLDFAMDNTQPFDPAALGLKEIGNLASWTVSSSKPGCGVLALRDDDTNLFWQSDGPQPHYLNIHFAKFAKIRAIRIFLDFEADESYTPTRIQLLGGTGYHDLIPFSELSFVQPKGWIDVNLDHVGGGSDGKTLRAFIIQVKVLENHQNGKDTHVRGLKIYSHDERHESPPPSHFDEKDEDSCSSIDPNDFRGPDDDLKRGDASGDDDQFWKDFTHARVGGLKMPDLSGLSEPGFMSEPELR
ncbi:hypothetical protein EAF04_006499 [Stromatinia cepivora]|nr:hypothetical protein EAF04_006499 [Stromatinia cepivora]